MAPRPMTSLLFALLNVQPCLAVATSRQHTWQFGVSAAPDDDLLLTLHTLQPRSLAATGRRHHRQFGVSAALDDALERLLDGPGTPGCQHGLWASVPRTRSSSPAGLVRFSASSAASAASELVALHESLGAAVAQENQSTSRMRSPSPKRVDGSSSAVIELFMDHGRNQLRHSTDVNEFPFDDTWA